MLSRAIGLLLIMAAAGIGANRVKPEDPGIHVECQGQLRHGVVAIGGETTGTTISFDRITWELQLPDEASRRFASEHHKQPVLVTGTLRRRAGTEKSIRWIVDVERISDQDGATRKFAAVVTVKGRLLEEPASDGSTQIVVEFDKTRWPMEFSGNEMLSAKARSLAGKVVVVKGRIERPDRTVASRQPTIHVTTLESPADDAGRD